MAILTPNIDKLIKNDELRLGQLQTELAESNEMVERFRTTAARLAVEGNDNSARERAENAKRAAQDSAESSVAAIAMVQERLAGLIASRDAAADRKTRRETADEIEQQLRMSGEIAREAETFFKRLTEFASWAQPFVPEAQGLALYCDASAKQIPEAIALIQKLVANHAQAVLAGTAPPRLRRLDRGPVAAPVAATPPTVQLFAVRSVKWKNAAGAQMIAQQFSDVSLTPSAAKRALAAGACVQMNDPVRQKNKGVRGGHAEPGFALDLDIDPGVKQTSPEPIRASSPQFVETIGQPKLVRIS